MATAKKIIKDAVVRLNASLKYYESGYISVIRVPEGNKERCNEFSQYIEARFNSEMCKIPQLYMAEILSEGRLFKCEEIEEEDSTKRKYKTATLKLNPKVSILDPDLPSLLEEVEEFLGGTEITFNGVKKKIKVVIK